MARGEAVSWKLWQNFRIKSFTFLVALCGNPYNHSHHGFELESRDRCAVSNKGWEFREQILNRIRPWAGFDPEHSSSYWLCLTIEERNKKLRLILDSREQHCCYHYKSRSTKMLLGDLVFRDFPSEKILLLKRLHLTRCVLWNVYYWHWQAPWVAPDLLDPVLGTHLTASTQPPHPSSSSSYLLSYGLFTYHISTK